MRKARQVILLLILSIVSLTGCDSLIPANQSMMKEAIDASHQAVRSEEKVWAMLLRIEELTQRLEASIRHANEAAQEADKAARDAQLAVRQAQELAAQKNVQQSKEQVEKLAEATRQAERAEAAAQQAEEVARRIESKEGENLQKMLEFMRELGYKP